LLAHATIIQWSILIGDMGASRLDWREETRKNNVFMA